MKKILLIGNCPLPNENSKIRPAAGLRTWQFLKPLLNEDFLIHFIGIAMPECYAAESPEETVKISENFTKTIISKNNPLLLQKIQKIHDEFAPDFIVSINTFPSYTACQINSDVLFWADLNGWIMAEAQAQAYKMDSNDYIPHYYEMEKNILSQADKISTVSFSQKYAVLGELAFLGRLNKETFNYNFVNEIPNATEFFEREEEILKNKNKKRTKIPVPDNAFVLLWMGGYNTWVDEDTLFSGLNKAIAQCKNLYFVSTGGEIEGLDNKTFKKFKEFVDKSEFKDRFIFLGWVKTDEIPYIYREANCGINVDRLCAETLTGARNRINEMMKFGLPFITTLGSEISYEAVSAGAGLGVKSGDFNGLADAVIYIYKEWESLSSKFREFSKNSAKFMERCDYKKSLKPLFDWLFASLAAPDRTTNLPLDKKSNIIKGAIRYFKENGAKKTFNKIFQRMKKN